MTFQAHPSSVIDPGAVVGKNTRIWHFVHVCKTAQIGENCVLGQGVYIGDNVHIGNNVKIQNNVSVYDGVTLEDDVFCGPSMVFTNVTNPRSHVPRKDQFTKTLVKKGASIGANATIVCGTTLGRYCFIGAGAVVTRDVPDFALVVGNPAHPIGWMCRCGERLYHPQPHTTCPVCKTSYTLQARTLICNDPKTDNSEPLP